MQKVVQINTTKTFENTVDTAISHLAQREDEYTVIEKIENLVEHFEEKVTDNPYLYSKCSELVEYGISEIRAFNLNGFRILYEAYEDGDKIVVVVLLLLSQKQSIQNQLIEHCILYK